MSEPIKTTFQEIEESYKQYEPRKEYHPKTKEYHPKKPYSRHPIYICVFSCSTTSDCQIIVSLLEGISESYEKPIGDWLLAKDNKVVVRLNSTKIIGRLFEKLMQKAVSCQIDFNFKPF